MRLYLVVLQQMPELVLEHWLPTVARPRFSATATAITITGQNKHTEAN